MARKQDYSPAEKQMFRARQAPPKVFNVETVEQGFRVSITFDTGAGAQVFTAPSLELLIGKLAQSVYHGTLKIRELTAFQKQVTAAREGRDPEPNPNRDPYRESCGSFFPNF